MRPRITMGALALLTTCCTIAFAPAGLAVTAPDEPDGTGTGHVEPDPARDAPTPSKAEREGRFELRELARAWADGGGTFGFPFWEKAGQRWHNGQITAPMYREYVTGYRDRLVVGCRLIEQVDVDSDTGRVVREHVLDSCEQRVDALRAQQRSLDVQVRRDGGDPDVDLARLDEQQAEHDAEARAALQESFRLARTAMDVAQTELDRTGQERLPEDAFI